MDEDTWALVDTIRRRRDDRTTPANTLDHRLLRIVEIGRDYADVMEAVRGALDADPRDSGSQAWEGVHHKVCDVITTGMIALATLTPEAERLLADHLERLTAHTAPS